MKYLLILLMLLLVVPAFGQVCQDSESDTLYVVEARAALRYALKDYNMSDKTWPDSVLNSYLYQAAWTLVPEKRDTIVTAANTLYYSMNADFVDMRGVIVKVNGRWSQLLKPDSSGGRLVKQDTVIASAGTMMYPLNNDFLGGIGVISKKGVRWSSLYPASLKGLETDKPFGRGSDKGNIQYYTIADKYLFLDTPPVESGDTLIIVYACFEYFVSDKRIVINAPVSGDSIIVFYAAYPNNFTGDSVIVNIPFKYREQLITKAVAFALRANRE